VHAIDGGEKRGVPSGAVERVIGVSQVFKVCLVESDGSIYRPLRRLNFDPTSRLLPVTVGGASLRRLAGAGPLIEIVFRIGCVQVHVGREIKDEAACGVVGS